MRTSPLAPLVASMVASTFAVVAVLAAPPAAARPASTTGPPPYQPPVPGPVVEGFVAPPGPYAPGHRGLTLAAAAGDPVVAAGPGTVTFAGSVAGVGWVVVQHPDGLRSTVGPLLDEVVSAGDRVQAGDPVGHAAGDVLVTFRRGEAYVDPSRLLALAEASPHLVPDRPRRAAPGGGHLGALDGAGLDRLASAAGALASGASRLLDLAATGSPPLRLAGEGVRALGEWWSRRGDCTPPTTSPPPPRARRLAVLVGGLGSSSEEAAIDHVDLAGLGYDPAEAQRFSYAAAGGPYGPADTLGPIAAAGAHLARWLAGVLERAPSGVPVDVLAHSQGGLVTRVALDALARDRPDLVGRLGLVVTFASPHLGAPLAGWIAAGELEPGSAAALEAVQRASGTGIEPSADAVRDLAPGSPSQRALSELPLPPGVRVLSIAGRGDVVVPSPRARLDGATNVIVPVPGVDDHAGVTAAPAARREVALALAGLPPTCRGLLGTLGDHMAGAAVDLVEGLGAPAG